MLINKLSADVKARTGLGRAFQLILAGSLLTNIMLAGSFMTLDKTQRTIFLPPQITKSFWVDGEQLSPEYIEQMGDWVVGMFATVSPASVDYKNASLLKLVHPENYGELQLRFEAGAMRLKAENLSKVFMPREIRMDHVQQRVAFIGTQDLWLGDKKVSTGAPAAYVVGFHFDGSFTTIRELREANPVEPFADAPRGDSPVLFNAVPQQPSNPLPPAGNSDFGNTQPALNPATLPPQPFAGQVLDPTQAVPVQTPMIRQ
ncbi:MAG: type IV conjugative transfer system protein TraE [Dechloromonas sp.]|nr:type IV conjugative transfer system protein TraE [Dechloromonas sp.]